MSREKHFEAIENLIRAAGASDGGASGRLNILLGDATSGLPLDNTASELMSMLEAEFDIFLASAMLYGDGDPSLNDDRKRLLALFAKLRGWLLVVEKRISENN